MLLIIVGTEYEARKKQLEAFYKKYGILPTDVLLLDDTQANLEDLISYTVDSLFGVRPVAIRARHLLDSFEGDTGSVLKVLHKSDTPIFLEEETVSSVDKKMLQKIGAQLAVTEKKKTEPKETIFSIANALAVGDKKKLWLEYHKLLETNTAEAIFGVLLWKIRQLALKEGSQVEKYKKLYKQFLLTQVRSRQTKLPLSLALEQALLSLER